MPGQLRLFAPSEEPPPVGPTPFGPELVSIASRLPPEIRLGTSSWAFPGWKGIVYDRDASQSANQAFVIVNNKAEGPAPLSVFKLAEEISRYQAIP